MFMLESAQDSTKVVEVTQRNRTHGRAHPKLTATRNDKITDTPLVSTRG